MNLNIVNANNSINYQALGTIDTFLARNITNIDEYIAWVREWKEINQQIVNSILFYKAEKNRFKENKETAACNQAWNRKVSLGKTASALYKARVENKARLHEGLIMIPNERVFVRSA